MTVPPTAWAAAKGPLRWEKLAAGVQYATFSAAGASGAKHAVRDKRLHVVRVDPKKAKLVALIASQLKAKPKTAGQWVREHGLVAAINLGMYQGNHRTHVGYLRSGTHINSRRWVTSYKSVLAFDPTTAAIPPLAFVDLDQGIDKRIFDRYRVVTQNLRLIKSNNNVTGKGVWSKQAKRWSEAAVALDKHGRLLFVFTRVPLTMWEFNRYVLALPLGIVRAMHMEGGPEASLSIKTHGLKLDLSGSFETGFFPNDGNDKQWPLPNVLGVAQR